MAFLAAAATGRRQARHLPLGHVEADPVLDSGHGADGDGDFLAPPQVPFAEQHVGHTVIAGMDEEALHPPYLAVQGMDRIAGGHLYLAHRNDVLDDDWHWLRYSRQRADR